MYNFSFQHDGLDYAYLAFDVTEEEMPKAFEGNSFIQNARW